MYTIMTEIVDIEDATDILYNLFGYRRNLNSVDFASLFENIENILDSSLQNDVIPRTTASKEMLSELGSYSRINKNSDLLGTQCSICLDEFKLNEGYRTLGCNHSYHKKCIDKWFIDGSIECPMCRKSPVGK